ncbi:MAG TPA: RIP metalloprotease RseP [Candidatus Acidoferrales bacterium]|nr:RIP metalloprotease RseP [Candidatus Acidoferrales bacterium]
MANFHNAVIAIVSVTIVLGILIFVHEWGHFVAAKLAGVRVDVFSFGFGPRIVGVKRGDTDYRLSVLPFGGYVRMAGDNPAEERTGADYEFLSKPRWVRMIIAIAGPTMNILLALVIFWGIFWLVGLPSDPYLRQPAQIAAIPQNDAGASGVQAGDQIVAVNGVRTDTWEKVLNQLKDELPGQSITLIVDRAGQEQTLTAKMPPASGTLYPVIGYPPEPAITDEIGIGTPAEKAGMKAGDKIVAMNGRPVLTWQQLVESVRGSDGHPIQFSVQRDGKDLTFDITPVQGMGVDGNMIWQVGVSPKIQLDFERQRFIPAGKEAALQTTLGMEQILQVLKGLFTGRVKLGQLSTVVGIARESGRAAKRGPMDLLWLMAVISLNLGLVNLLPIPILDGGHLLMLAIEGTLRRDLSVAVKERFVQVGLVFLLGIFAFVMYSDIFKLIQFH